MQCAGKYIMYTSGVGTFRYAIPGLHVSGVGVGSCRSFSVWCDCRQIYIDRLGKNYWV